MSGSKKYNETKFIAVHLPVDLVKKPDSFKEKSGESRNAVLVRLIQDGLSKRTIK